MKKKGIAVVITTYNNPRALELCLLSLAEQSYLNFEVYVADDGSKDETRDLLLRLKTTLPFQLYHYWHPDEGYRKAKINNKVFRELSQERTPLVICIDHDVILHPRFIEDHYRIHEKNEFKPLLFMGRRVDLSEAITKSINPSNLKKYTSGLTLDLVLSSIKGETKNVLRSVRVEGPKWLLKLLKRDRVYDLLGSNFSITLECLLRVNGYNEDFESYWGEDGDLFVRVRNQGIPYSGVIGYAIQWHLYHGRLTETKANREKVEALLGRTDYIYCENGIKKPSSI